MAILMRFDRPIGWWLLLLPAWVVMPIGARDSGAGIGHLAGLMGLFFIGAVVMRGGGCVINDLCDRNIDKSVARTANRPLASGRISVVSALILLAVLGGIGLGVLMQLPIEAVVIGIASLPFISTYPLAKRFTNLPQILLGLTFAWGVLLGWGAFGAYPDMRVFWLYGGVVFWIFGYDTIYAIQDMADDRRIGIGSSALWLAGRGRLRFGVGVSYGLAVAGWIGFGVMSDAPAFLLAVAVGAGHFCWQVARIDGADALGAGRIFRSNRNLGLILVAGAVADYLRAL